MIWIEKGFVVVCWRDFFIYYNFVSANSCGICEEGRHSEFRRPFPLLALLPSGHGGRAVARIAGKAPTADRLPQTAASDALSPKANEGCHDFKASAWNVPIGLHQLNFHTPLTFNTPQPSVPNGGGS